MLNSIKKRLMFSISVAVLVIIFIMISVVNKIVTDEQTKLATENAKNTTASLSNEFNTLISRKLELSQGLTALLEEHKSGNRQEIMRMFENVLKKDKEIIDVFLAFEPNAFDAQDEKYKNTPGHDSTGNFNFNYNRYSGNIEVAPGIDTYISEYYTLPKTTGKPVVTEPFLYEGVLLSTFTLPVYKNGSFAGVAGVDIALNDINSIVSKVKIYETGYAFILSKGGIMVTSDKKDEIGSKNFFEIVSSKFEGDFSKMKSDVESGTAGIVEAYDKRLEEDVEIFYSPVKASNWCYAVVAPKSEMLSGAAKTRTSLIVIGFIGVGIMLLLAKVISDKISKPIVEVTKAANLISAGDLNVSIESRSGDEIGEMISAFNALTAAQRNKLEAVNDIVAGKLRKVSLASDKDELAHAFNKVIETIEGMLKEINFLLHEAAEGKLNSRIDSNKFAGSWGELLNGINQLLNAIVDPLKESSLVLDALSKGDMTANVLGNYKGEFKLLGDRINRVAVSLDEALNEVTQSVSSTLNAAVEISSSTEQMAAGAQEQSRQVTEIAAAIEELSKTIFESTKSASTASESSMEAMESAKIGVVKVNSTKDGMSNIVSVTKSTSSKITALTEKADQIGEITQVIDDIADQTNLLALNAAIEAARAGEQGRGFAVVADEVRKLAERTTKATKEIAQNIKAIQTGIHEANNSMNEAEGAVNVGMELTLEVADALQKVVAMISEVNDFISHVASANEEQSTVAEQVSKSVESISGVVQESAAGTQEIARTAEHLNNLTLELQKTVKKFKLTNGRLMP